MASHNRNGARAAAPPIVSVEQGLDALYHFSNLPTIATPFPRLNAVLGGGLISGQSVVMPGATGSGKTSLLGAIASHVAQTTAVLIGTYELPIHLLIARIGSQQLDVPWLDVLRGKIKREVLQKHVPMGIDFMYRPEPHQLMAAVKRISDRESAAPLVLLDYLQIMTSLQQHEDPRIATASTSAQVRDLADHTKAPVLLAAAVSRENTKVLRQARRADSASELAGIARDVSNVEYDAAAVLALAVSPLCDEKDGHQDAMLAVSKNRFGPSEMIGLRFEGKSGRWFESTSALEPNDEEREEIDDAIMRSVRASKTHLTKHGIIVRNGRTYVRGRKADILTRIEVLAREGQLAEHKRDTSRGMVREYSLPPKQTAMPLDA